MREREGGSSGRASECVLEGRQSTAIDRKAAVACVFFDERFQDSRMATAMAAGGGGFLSRSGAAPTGG